MLLEFDLRIIDKDEKNKGRSQFAITNRSVITILVDIIYPIVFFQFKI